MKPFFGIGIVLFTLSVCTIVACGQNTPPNDSPTPNKKKIPTGYQLFESNKSPAQIAAAKQVFIQTPIVKIPNLAPGAFNPAEFDMFNLGSSRHVALGDTAGNVRMMATSPVVGTYNAPDVEVSLSVSFPPEFRNNIPLNIKNEILKYDLDSLEIYFSPQRVRGNVGNPGSEARLRTHFWYLQAPQPAGTNVAGDLLMGIYGSDHPIAADVPNDQVSSHSVSIHPGGGITLYSPSNTMLNFNQTMLNMSSWSLVIDETGKRAVVTLHWLLNPPTHIALVGHLNAMAGTPATNYLDQLIARLDLDPGFQGTSMLRKLKDLIQ